MVKKIEPDFSFSDSRGELVQLIHQGYRQINVITSKKGVVRGGHYHKENSEAFYIISGKLELTVGEACLQFQAGDFFGIEPYDRHSFYFMEDTILVSMYSNGVELENGKKDIYPG
ncbi:cupin domain-containing protein [uncultured Bacteroides sp.]|uniref:cupin domain-containing protein n=1 Tax=uncultured Bacteroides sp. TaxID=162156 RepID=UPI00261C4939|nr:cupin domain-containing protein [uncultured Bacteroides sp.]